MVTCTDIVLSEAKRAPGEVKQPRVRHCGEGVGGPDGVQYRNMYGVRRRCQSTGTAPLVTGARGAESGKLGQVLPHMGLNHWPKATSVVPPGTLIGLPYPLSVGPKKLG